MTKVEVVRDDGYWRLRLLIAQIDRLIEER